jgi:hypothetical protein
VKPNASDIPLDPITGMSATNVQSGISELKGTLTDYDTLKTPNVIHEYVIPNYASVSNCNDKKAFGIYQGNGASNAPSNGWITLIVLPFGNDNGNYCSQLCFGMTSNKVWIRYQNNGTWSAWTALHS